MKFIEFTSVTKLELKEETLFILTKMDIRPNTFLLAWHWAQCDGYDSPWGSSCPHKAAIICSPVVSMTVEIWEVENIFQKLCLSYQLAQTATIF